MIHRLRSAVRCTGSPRLADGCRTSLEQRLQLARVSGQVKRSGGCSTARTGHDQLFFDRSTGVGEHHCGDSARGQKDRPLRKSRSGLKLSSCARVDSNHRPHAPEGSFARTGGGKVKRINDLAIVPLLEFGQSLPGFFRSKPNPQQRGISAGYLPPQGWPTRDVVAGSRNEWLAGNGHRHAHPAIQPAAVV